MLTRLEVDGFKNLLKFEVDFGAFNCIAGPNGVGKSNIFDAIRFLSLLADNTITEAARNVRGDLEMADVRDIFWTDGEDRAEMFHIAAEMIVDSQVLDDIGRSVDVKSTYLRYEVEIAYSEPNLSSGDLGGLVLRKESLHGYSKEQAKERLRFPYTNEFFDAVIRNRKGGRTFISTEKRENGHHALRVHANGSFPEQIIPTTNTQRTIVGVSSQWADPSILAAKREMQNWRVLAIDPAAIRRADPLHADPHLTPKGGHLHATLYRIAHSAAKYDLEPEQIYGFVRTQLTGLKTVTGLSVKVDPDRQLLMTYVKQRFRGGTLPARALSDGMLRFLALAVLNEDPEIHGLVCIEEPENSIHPGKMEELVELLKEIAVDTDVAPDDEFPMRQVIIATHSPYLVQLLLPDDLLIAVEITTGGPSGQPANVLRCWPLPDTWRSCQSGRRIGWTRMFDYLFAPPDARVKLPAYLFEDEESQTA